MKLIAAVAFLACIIAGAHAGDSYGYNPCKAKGMYSANTGDVSKFVRAAGLQPYVELGACAYLYFCNPTGSGCDIGLFTSTASQLMTGATLGGASIQPADTGITELFDGCSIRDLDLDYLCVGTPYGVYTDPRIKRRSRAMLGDDDDDYKSSDTFPFFTRFAMSLTVKARYNFDGYGWNKVTFPIKICIDINRAGEFGLPSGDGDLIDTCGNLDFTDYGGR